MQKHRTRQVSGRLAKIAGDGFEKLFENLCQIQGVAFVRVPNGMRQIGPGRFIRCTSPFDCIINYGDQNAVLDLKSIAAGNFTYSMITRHQVVNLKKLAPGCIAGYVIALADFVYFFDVSILDSIKPRGSLNIKQGIFLGLRHNFDIRRIFSEVKRD